MRESVAAAWTGAVPVQDGLFVWPPQDGEARLVVSRCPQCGDASFPAVPHCRMPRCSLVPTEGDLLSGTGTVLAWTVQRYAPPGPFGRAEPYKPISIALVDFAEHHVAVLGQVFDAGDLDLASGQAARLVLRTLYADGDGHDVAGWGFVLTEQGAAR